MQNKENRKKPITSRVVQTENIKGPSFLKADRAVCSDFLSQFDIHLVKTFEGHTGLQEF